MLEACGLAAEPAAGRGDRHRRPVSTAPGAGLGGPRPAVVRTFSRSQPEGWRLRSLLERYDFEHGLPGRRSPQVAAAADRASRSRPAAAGPPDRESPSAAAATGGSTAGPSSTPTTSACASTRARWTSREIVTLRRHGIDTITDLAGVDLDELLDLVSARGHPPQRRRGPAAHRGPPGPDAAGRHAGSTGRPADRSRCPPPTSRSTSTSRAPRTAGSTCGGSWSSRPTAGRSTTSSAGSPIWTTPAEAALAGRRSSWLRSVVEARRVGWSSTTTAGTRWPRSGRWPTGQDDPLLDWAAAYAEEQFVDLLEIVKTHYFGVAGLGLKLMAQHAGFSLARRRPRRPQLPASGSPKRCTARTPEPRAAARQRVLEYNEDDVHRHQPSSERGCEPSDRGVQGAPLATGRSPPPPARSRAAARPATAVSSSTSVTR